MNYECPLSKNRLQEEQEELLLKMALVRYFEREDANLRAAVAECPDFRKTGRVRNMPLTGQ